MPPFTRRLACASLSALALCGCGGDDPGPDGAAAPDAPAATATPDPVPTRRIAFRATDGKPLHGRLAPAAGGDAGVVLVHEIDGTPAQWDDFVRLLHADGLTTLAYRSRGTNTADERLLARDIAGAAAELARRLGVGRGRIGVVGASIGATATAWLAGGTPGRGLAAFVALSPVPFSRPAPRAWQPHDLLVLADEEERIYAEALLEPARDGYTLEQTPVFGHGVGLLPDARVSDRVRAWLRARLG